MGFLVCGSWFVVNGLELYSMGPSWGYVGLSWPILGLCWPILRAIWAHLRAMLAHLGAMLAHLGAMLAHLGPILGRGPTMLAYVGLSCGQCGPSLTILKLKLFSFLRVFATSCSQRACQPQAAWLGDASATAKHRQISFPILKL